MAKLHRIENWQLHICEPGTWTMELEGVVHNGVIIPANSAGLAEGTRVRIVFAPADGDSQRSQPRHSALDIRPVSVGSILQTQAVDGDLLGEMLEGRQ